MTEELWMPPQGDLMLALSRTVAPGKATRFEFLLIGVENGRPYYEARPQGGPPTRFGLSASGPGWAEFANPEHDFPKAVRYERAGDALKAEIRGPGRDGETRVSWSWGLVK